MKRSRLQSVGGALSLPRSMLRTIACWAAVITLSAPGCDRAPLSGPPKLRLGRDECGACGMIISEERCSSALLVERDGRREHIIYDDLGCMLDAERDGLDRRHVVQRWVHDYDDRSWIAAQSATFLYADEDKLITPMGSGIAAFSARDAAEVKQRQTGGRLLNYDELGPLRTIWLEVRREVARERRRD